LNIVSGQGTTEIEVIAGTAGGDIVVEAQNDCGASAAVTFPVTVRPALAFNGTIKNEGSVCNGLRYSVEPVNGASSYDWTLPAGWVITNGAGTNIIDVTAVSDTGTVSVIARNAGCSSPELKVAANAGTAFEPVAPNAFSPNQDGVNETWQIKNLENYPDNEVSVINRWGNEVYKKQNYRNNWDGQNLSPGTYYYVLRVKLCNNMYKTYKGFVMIIR
jgi:gliding motility-associated-like protein